jgi:hypothetical protein
MEENKEENKETDIGCKSKAAIRVFLYLQLFYECRIVSVKLLLGCLARGTHVSNSQTNLKTVTSEASVITAKQRLLHSNINISKIFKEVIKIQLATHVFSFPIL